MLTFRPGAAGARSAAMAMAGHLTEQTLPAPQRDLAEYYTRGVGAAAGVGDEVRDAARMVADGALTYAEAHDQLLASLYQGIAGEIDPVHGVPKLTVDAAQMEGMEDRIGEALTDLTVFYAEGGQDERHGTSGEVRQDIHPLIAEALGLDPNLAPSQEEIANLFEGKRADGAALPGNQREISFIDLCWSADKSVSLAWAFAPTEAERASILQAHRDAVDDAMAYMAREIGVARRGRNGVRQEQGHIGWIKFDHFTSRATLELPVADPATGKVATELHTLKQAPGDPNLHTHVAVLNAVATDDGWLGGLYIRRMRGRVHEFGAYYQARLATRLREIGADVVLDRKTGAARIAGISDRVRDAYSKRTREAEAAARDFAAAAGADWDSMTPEAKVAFVKTSALNTRRTKADDLSDFDGWKHQAEAMGWAWEGALRPERAMGLREHEIRMERAYQAALPFVEQAFAKSAVLTPSDLRTAATRGLVAAGIEDVQDVHRVTRMMRERGVTQDGRRTALIWGEDSENGIRITTALHKEQEDEFVRLARDGAANRSGSLTRREIETAAQASGLDFSSAHGQAQHDGMMRLGTGGRVGVFIAAAGAGKTASLRPVVSAYQARGAEVHGVALAWRQADELAHAGVAQERIASMARFLSGVRNGWIKVGPQSVVAVDEVGLLGGRQGLELLKLREQHGFTLLMVGDDKQCRSIEATQVIGMLREALGADAIPEISTTIRQQAQREREIAGLFREGEAGRALAMKREDGTVELVPGGYREAVQRVADLWAERSRANAGREGYSLTVSAPTNADARAISEAIRAKRREMGQLGEDYPKLVRATDQQGSRYDMALAPGDRVRLFDRVFGRDAEGKTVRVGNNGTVIEVLGIGEAGLTVKGLDGEAVVRWASLRGRDGRGRVRLAYGDVLTIDSAQGITSTEHIAAMPAGSRMVDGLKGYVSLSRHREATYLVTSDGQERQEVAGRRPLGDVRPISEQDVMDNLARNLSRQEIKDTATAFLARAHQIERGAARSMQAALRPVEARALAGIAPPPPQALARGAEMHRLRQAASRLAERLELAMQARRDAALARGLDSAQARQGRGLSR